MISAKEAKENTKLLLHKSLQDNIDSACKVGLTKTSILCDDIDLLKELFGTMKSLGYSGYIHAISNLPYLEVSWK